MVLHKGQVPNPLEVVLTSQNLICRYREAFHQIQTHKESKKSKPRTPVFNQDWQILIKVAAYKNRRD